MFYSMDNVRQSIWPEADLRRGKHVHESELCRDSKEAVQRGIVVKREVMSDKEAKRREAEAEIGYCVCMG